MVKNSVIVAVVVSDISVVSAKAGTQMFFTRVVPVKTGAKIWTDGWFMDSRLRGNDDLLRAEVHS